MIAPQTRGQLLQRLGVQVNADRVPIRNDDGSYTFSPPCPDCGSSRLRIEWSDTKKLLGEMRHMDGDAAGCGPFDVAEVIAERFSDVTTAVPNATPSPVEVKDGKPVLHAVPAELDEALACDPGVNMVQFIVPVSVMGLVGAIPFWSRNKHGGKIGLRVAAPYVVLSWGDEIRRVPFQNVAFIAEKKLRP